MQSRHIASVDMTEVGGPGDSGGGGSGDGVCFLTWQAVS